MKEVIQIVLACAQPIVLFILIVLAATRKGLKGKSWLITYLVGILVLGLLWWAPPLVDKLGIEGMEFLATAEFYEWFGLSMRIFGFVVMCLLIPYVVAAASSEGVVARDIIEQTEPDSDNPDSYLTPERIGGWLILPSLGLIFGGILSVVGIAVSVVAASDVASDYQTVFAVNIICDVGLTAFLFVAAVRFFGKRRSAPATMIALMATCIVVNAVLVGINLAADSEASAMAYGEALVRGVIGSAIWIPYFLVSKRVKRTFVVP